MRSATLFLITTAKTTIKNKKKSYKGLVPVSYTHLDVYKRQILYFSVRKGDRNGRYNGRYFYDYDREALNDLLDSFSNIKVLDIWKTSDVRTDKDNRWFNVLLRKEKQD